MEWKTKPEPEEGQHRERLIFALRPRKCEDGITRWLCNVRILEEYKIDTSWEIPHPMPYPRWVEIKAYAAEFERVRKKV